MAKRLKLKVYRTPIGFHDAYVAAASQKAALKAWGADVNLFARGVAEHVTDPALMEAPLAHPGEVVRRLRGSREEHLGALPPDPEPSKRRRNSRPAAPPPSRANVEAAEQALAEAEVGHADHRAALKQREDALARERRALLDAQTTELNQLQHVRDQEQRAYDAAVRRWQG